MRILASFAFSFAAAVAAAVYGKLDSLLPTLGGTCLLAFVLMTFLRKGHSRAEKRARIVLMGLAVGFLWTAVYKTIFFRPAEELSGRTVRLSATVADWPQEGEYGGYSVLVKADTERNITVSAVLYVDEQGAKLRPGDRIETVAHCTLGDRTFAGEEITYYTAKGIFLRVEAYGRLDIQRPDSFPWIQWPAYLSQYLKEGIDAAFPERAAGFVRALVTGNRDNLTDQFTTSLERTGLSHTVAVSGMHLAFLAGVLTALMGRGKRSTAVLTILWVVLFCGIAGNTPSVLRAAVMILMLQLAPLLDRERDGATALALALFLLLLANPFSAAHIGLQLSFAAVAGIQLVSDPIQEKLLTLCRLKKRPRNLLLRILRTAPYFAISTISATLGASVLTVPLVALHFNLVSLIAPLSNLLTLWAIGILFMGGVVLGALGVFLPGAAAVLAIPFTWLSDYLEWVVDVLSRPALAALPLESSYYRFWVVFIYLLALVTLRMRGRRPLWLPVAAGGATLALSVALTAAGFYLGDGAVAVLDVGQGQSVLLRTGSFLTLVDCGGEGQDDPGDVAANYVQSLGRSAIDLLVVSHYHADHASGIPQLLNRLTVREIALPDVEEGDPLREEILSIAEERGIPVRFIREDTRFDFGEGGRLQLIAPVDEAGETNELGLTALATVGTFDVLITGDMGGDSEEKLLDIVDLPDIEVMVVGHHGSANSTTQALLDAAGPDLALISAGEDNRYGHPAPDTLDRLDKAGADIYRTDLYGTLLVTGRG